MSLAPISIAQNRAVSSDNFFPKNRKNQQSIIEDVARRCLVELALSLAIGSAAVFFTATPFHGALIFACIAVQTIANAALRCARALAARSPMSEDTKQIQSAADYLCPTMFAYLTAWNGQTLIHEAGHAMGAVWMFQNANPQITITPCFGGVTRFATAELTAWGGRVGKDNALLITALMGPAVSLLVSSIALAVGFAVRGKFPELSSYLVCVAMGDFYTHALYAISAIPSTGTFTHDFIRLKSYGINPLISAIVILAIPILIAHVFSPAETDQGTLRNELQPLPS